MERIVFVLCLALAACMPTPREEGQAPMTNQGLPAPTPEDVVLRIGADKNGQAVEVAVNQRFAIELVGVPTAGYLWTPSELPPFVSRAGQSGGPTSPEQNQPGFAGGSHWEVLMFVATGPGEGEIVIEQRRPWESTEPAVDVFRVRIVAR